MRRLLLATLIAMMAGGLRASPQRLGATAEFLSMFESRHDPPEFMRGLHTCTFFVRLHHPSLVKAEAYANVCITDAVDDTGASLVDQQPWYGLVENVKLHVLKPGEIAGGPDPSIILEFRVAPAARSATKVVRMLGHVQVRTRDDHKIINVQFELHDVQLP